MENNNNVLERQIELIQLQQLLKQQKTTLATLLYDRDELYRMSFSVGRQKTIIGRIKREYIREPYLFMVELIEKLRKSIDKIEKRIEYLESFDLRKIPQS